MDYLLQNAPYPTPQEGLCDFNKWAEVYICQTRTTTLVSVLVVLGIQEQIFTCFIHIQESDRLRKSAEMVSRQDYNLLHCSVINHDPDLNSPNLTERKSYEGCSENFYFTKSSTRDQLLTSPYCTTCLQRSLSLLFFICSSLMIFII